MTLRILRRSPTPAIGSLAASDHSGTGYSRARLLVAIVLILLGTFAVYGLPVPGHNEPVYLLVIERLSNPDFMATDWTLSSGFDEHFAFNRLAAPLAGLFDLSVLAWIGRLASWTALAVLILKLGRRLGVSYLGSAAAVLVWIGMNESIWVGAETVLGSGFEAKALAYPLLFGALLFALDHRVPPALVLAGLTATIHPAVGLWGSGALVAALLWEKSTCIQTLKWLPAMALAAGPGLLSQVRSLAKASIGVEETEFLALERMPHHMDPTQFGRRGWLLMILILAFNFLYGWSKRSEYVQRILLTFQTLGIVAMVAGVAAHFAGQYWFPLTFPFRVLPPMAVLIFCLHMAAGFERWRRRGFERPSLPGSGVGRLTAVAGVLAVIAIVGVRNPVVEFVRASSLNLTEWTDDSDADFEAAMDWIATNTPPDASFLGPPYEDQLMWLSNRDSFVSWKAIPYDRVEEWLNRLELIGIENVEEDPEDLIEAYGNLAESEVSGVVTRYGLDYVVTTAPYSFPTEAAFGAWKVYRTTS